jgi:hypothetical protein
MQVEMRKITNGWRGDEKTIIQACEAMYPDPEDDHKYLISTKSCIDGGTKIRKKLKSICTQTTFGGILKAT